MALIGAVGAAGEENWGGEVNLGEGKHILIHFEALKEL